MKTLKWLCFFAAVVVASSLLTTGTAWAVARQLNQNVFADLFTGEAGSGSNSFAVTTNGSRIDVGAGTNDYFVSDGTIVSTAGRFDPCTALGSGATCMNLADGTYVTWTGGEYARGSAGLRLSSPTYVDALKVPVVHNAGLAEQALESGTGALTASALAVTFNQAFGAAPNCVCSHIAATPLPCGPAAASSTTAITFNVPAGAGSIYWFCMGNR